MGDVTVGWKTLLTIDSPVWHDSISTVVADNIANDLPVREAYLSEYSDLEATIDILIVAYLAVQHSRIKSEEYLIAALGEIKCQVGSVILCAVDRAAPKTKVTEQDTRSVLDDQASLYGQDRYGYRIVSPDALGSQLQQHLNSKFMIAKRRQRRDESVDPAIGLLHEEIDRGNYA